jgi:hypothetical protein
MSVEAVGPRKPPFLKIVMAGAALMGSFGALMSAVVLVGMTIVPGPYMINGRRASFDEFMGFAVPAVGSYFVMSVAALGLSWGLRHDRLWTRPLLLILAGCAVAVPLLLAFVSGLDPGRVMPTVLVCALMLVVLWWQLYYDDDILAYYAAVRERERG